MHATDRISSPVVLCAGVLASLLLAGMACLAQAPPGRVLVSDVLIQGSGHEPTDQVKAQLKTRVGAEYNPGVVEEDVRTLYGTRRFGNVAADKVEDGPGKVKVIFRIRDFPSVVQKVQYLGANHMKPDELESLTGIRRGLPLNPHANKAACERIIAEYNEKGGRPFASCTLLKGGEPGDTEVVFNIVEGPKVKVTSVAFTGNTFVSGGVLAQHIHTSPGMLKLGLMGSAYVPAMIEADMIELMKYYKGFGFQDVRISRELKHSADGREVGVVFHISEGVRYRVKDKPQVHGVASMPHERLEALSKIQPGEYYSQAKVDADIANIQTFLGATGHKANARAEPIWVKEAPGICTVRYEIREEPPARVGQIIIVGNDRTKQNVILRQIPLYPGQVLQFPALKTAENNLGRLGIFEVSPDGAVRPTVQVLPSDSPYKDILVNVNETSTGSVLFGLGVNSDSGLTGSVVLNENNFDIFNPPTSIEDFLNGSAWHGAGQQFRIQAVPGTQVQNYTVTFSEPFLFDSPYRLTTSGYYNQRYYNEYTEERYGVRATIGRKLDQYWSVSGTVRAENVNVSNVGLGAPVDYTSVVGDNFQVGFRGNITRDARDNYMRPTSGSLLDLSFEQVTGKYTFPLATIDFSKFFTLTERADGSGKQVLAIHDQAGWAGDNTPVYERYFAGGFRTLRGFQFRGVGPDVNGYKIGGDFLVLNSLEYQIPVTAGDKIYIVGFCDSGAVSQSASHIDDYRVSVGFGLRLVIPGLGPVPVALDFGFPIVKGPSDNTQVFNFWMGFFR